MSTARFAGVQPFTRRGVCPALSAPMQTGDGLLSRVAFTDTLSPQQVEKLCTLALRHGNGLVDITARGSVQFRGLTAERAALLERDVLALGLPLRQGLAVETSPLAGMDETATADTRSIVNGISEGAAALHLHEKLAAKMSVVIDGCGHVDMGDLLADIRLKAVRANDDVLWHLMLGGTEDKALQAGLLRTEHAADVVIDLLMCLADRGSDARGRDLDIEQLRAVCAGRLLEKNRVRRDVAARFFSPPGRSWPPSINSDESDEGASSPYPLIPAPSSRCGDLLPLGEKTESGTLPADKEAHQYGLMRLSEGLFTAAFAPAYGHIQAEALSSICTVASTLGIRVVRPGPAHALYFLGNEEACQTLLTRAHEAGFVTSADDPRSAIAVCAGKPACASAFIAARELAEHAATECATLLDGSFTLHLSGCGKGCAHPASALLAFAGSAEGFAFKVSGRVCDTPDAILPITEQKAALSQLARLYEKEHKPGENARSLLARLGRQRLVAALRQDDR